MYYLYLCCDFILQSVHMATHFIFSAFNYRPVSLPATNEGSVFSFAVCTFVPHKLTSSAQVICWCAAFNFNSSPCVCTFLKACTVAKLKSHGGKRLLFGQFWVGSVSDRRLNYRNVLRGSYKHSGVNLTTFMRTLNSKCYTKPSS